MGAYYCIRRTSTINRSINSRPRKSRCISEQLCKNTPISYPSYNVIKDDLWCLWCFWCFHWRFLWLCRWLPYQILSGRKILRNELPVWRSSQCYCCSNSYGWYVLVDSLIPHAPYHENHTIKLAKNIWAEVQRYFEVVNTVSPSSESRKRLTSSKSPARVRHKRIQGWLGTYPGQYYGIFPLLNRRNLNQKFELTLLRLLQGTSKYLWRLKGMPFANVRVKSRNTFNIQTHDVLQRVGNG